METYLPFLFVNNESYGSPSYAYLNWILTNSLHVPVSKPPLHSIQSCSRLWGTVLRPMLVQRRDIFSKRESDPQWPSWTCPKLSCARMNAVSALNRCMKLLLSVYVFWPETTRCVLLFVWELRDPWDLLRENFLSCDPSWPFSCADI